MDPELAQAIAMINAQIAQGGLQLQRDIYSNISYPTSFGQNTGFLPQGYPEYGGMPTFGALTGTAGMFGMAGTDPRWVALGYQNGQETLGGRQVGYGQGQTDTEMGMTYGSPVVGGQVAPDWMVPHVNWAQNYARSHGGIAPTQAQLTQGIAGAVNQAIQGLQQNPQYQQANGDQRREMEAQAVAGVTGQNAQQALSTIQDLRQWSAQHQGQGATDQQILESVGRWQNPADDVAAVNQAMTRLRTRPDYINADGDTRRQMEAQEIATAANIPVEQAATVVQRLRAGSAGSGSLSANDAVAAALQAVRPNTQTQYGQQAPPVYGQQDGRVQGGPVMTRADQGEPTSVRGEMEYQRRPGYGGYQQPGLPGINFGGSNALAGSMGQAMSPQMRALLEQSRQFDVGAQIQNRGQDIGMRGQDIQSQLGNRGYDVQSQLGNRGLDVTMRGQDFGREANQNQTALQALQQESQLRADPFKLAQYRYGLSQSGIPGVVSAVAGSGVLPGVQGGHGQAPGVSTLAGQIQEMQGARGGVSAPGEMNYQRRGGMPTFGAGGAAGQYADVQRQAQALGPLSQINGRQYVRAGVGGQNYVNSLYKGVGQASTDQEVQEAARKSLPQFARGRYPTFGRVA